MLRSIGICLNVMSYCSFFHIQFSCMSSHLTYINCIVPTDLSVVWERNETMGNHCSSWLPNNDKFLFGAHIHFDK